MIDIPVGINENYNSVGFSVYPNPCNDKLTISSTESLNYTFEITDVTSKVILSQQRINSNTIDVSSLEKGIYFLKVLDGNILLATKKIIKE